MGWANQEYQVVSEADPSADVTNPLAEPLDGDPTPSSPPPRTLQAGDAEEEQGEGQRVLHPPGDPLHVVALVGRVGPPACPGSLVPPRRWRLLVHGRIPGAGANSARPRVAVGPDDPNRHLPVAPRVGLPALGPAVGLGAEDARGVLEQRGERRVDEARGGEAGGVAPGGRLRRVRGRVHRGGRRRAVGLARREGRRRRLRGTGASQSTERDRVLFRLDFSSFPGDNFDRVSDASVFGFCSFV